LQKGTNSCGSSGNVLVFGKFYLLHARLLSKPGIDYLLVLLAKEFISAIFEGSTCKGFIAHWHYRL
jgi:hypothetical protein